jgi:hypothetical protein
MLEVLNKLANRELIRSLFEGLNVDEYWATITHPNSPDQAVCLKIVNAFLSKNHLEIIKKLIPVQKEYSQSVKHKIIHQDFELIK